MHFKENSFCYLNGKIVKLKDAKISPFDLGFARGYAVTEVLRAYDGKIFLFDEHYARLKNATKMLKITLKESKEELKNIMLELIKKNKCSNAKIKLVLSPGIGKTDLDLGNNETLFVYAQEYIDFPSSFYTDGIKLITAKFKRNLSEVKSSDYIEAIRLRGEMSKKKAGEILYILNDYIFECSTSNIFMIKGDTLVTPKIGVLMGVTRGFVVNFAGKIMKVVERDIKFSELIKADEVFITATTKQIMPVVKIDDFVIKSGRVGKKTIELQKLFNSTRDKKLQSLTNR